MGTIRKSSGGFPETLQDLKAINKALDYGGTLAVSQEWTLCFAWQDNNVVLGLTTAFSLHRASEDFVLRLRKRPKESSTNASISRRVFGSQPQKKIPIPKAIDAYNHGMNAVDVANQLRQNFSCHRAYETRNWRPLAWWLFDVCLVNNYVLWRAQQPKEKQRSRHLHREFEKTLINQLLRRGTHHQLIRLDKRGYCRWGAKYPEDCLVGARQRHKTNRETRLHGRKALKEITNDSRPVPRGRNVTTGCGACNVHLCKGT